jgi:hypothetical protein
MLTSSPRPHRFHPTPCWLIYASLAMTGLLWLSERFKWFPFNEHKGWTVLIAVAGLGVALLLMALWFLVASIFRRRFQFSIRSLLVLTVAVALPCSWLGVEIRRAREQAAAVQRCFATGGLVVYDFDLEHMDDTPNQEEREWTRRVLGRDFFDVVIAVENPSDEAMKCLDWLNEAWWFALSGKYATDSRLAYLAGHFRLRRVDIANSTISDRGLECLESQKDLRVLILGSSPVTDAAVKRVQQALPKCKIEP